MTKLILIIAAFAVPLLPCSGMAQEDPMRDLLTQDKCLECGIYAFNAETLIPRLHMAGELDSVEMILSYIDEICHIESFKNYRLLRQIDATEFPDDFCDTAILNEILRSYYPYPCMGWFQPFRCSDPDVLGYDVFIRDYAKSLLEMTDTNSTAHLLCLYYGGEWETLLGKLRNGVYAGTCFQAGYDEKIAQVKQRLNSGKLHWSLNLGIWKPFDNADILGPKLEFGGEAGYRGKRLGFDLTALLRVLKSREEYVIKHDDDLITTDHFFGGFFGGSLIYQVVKPGSFGLETFAGIGYEAIEAYHEKDDFENLNAFNMNLGLNIQFPLDKMKARYMGVQARYNIVGYYTHGGTDLTGNTLSLNLVYGYLGNPSAISEALRLRYYD